MRSFPKVVMFCAVAALVLTGCAPADASPTANPTATSTVQPIIELADQAAAAAETANALLICEASAASAYWSAWSQVPITFGRRDAALIPGHWRMFGTRSSPLSGGPRLAVNPANALVNWIYAILESEATSLVAS